MTLYRIAMLTMLGALLLIPTAEARAQTTAVHGPPAAPARVPPPMPAPRVMQGSPLARRGMAPEDRIALLEEALQRAEQRIVLLEQRLNTHTHTYQYMVTGLLREQVNGRFLDLAIAPHALTGTTNPPR